MGLDWIHMIEYTPLPRQQPATSYLHIPPAGNPDGLAAHIRKQRARNAQNRPRCLLRTGRPPQRDIRIRIRLAVAGAAGQLLPGNAQRNLGPVGRGHEGAGLLGRGEACLDEAEGDSVGAHVEARPPFLGDGFGQPDHAGFGDGVVDLAAGGESAELHA